MAASPHVRHIVDHPQPPAAQAPVARPRLPEWAVSVAVLAVALTGTLVAVYYLQAYTPDDAYITYRFARNIVAGHGWTFNAGEATGNAATSPLYTAILALGGAAIGPAAIPTLGTAVFVGGLTGAAWFTHRSLSLIGLPAAAWFSVPLITVNPWLASTRGMETALFLLAVTLALWLALTHRIAWAGAVCGLATLIRGDGILLAAVLGLTYLAHGWRPTARFALSGVAVGLPWMLYATAALGSPLPNTLAAKIAQGRSGFWGEGLLYLTTWTGLLTPSPSRTAWATMLAVLAVGGVIGGRRHVVGDVYLRSLTVVTVALVGVYGFVLNVPGYHWYYALPVFTITVLAAVGLGWIAGRWQQLAVVGLLRLATGVTVLGVAVSLGLSGFYAGFNGTDYVAIGNWLRGHTAVDDRIAAAEIGYIGWASQRPIVDYLGLLSPQSADELAQGDTTSWIMREEPDYWVSWEPPIRVDEDVTEIPWFPYAYQPVHRHSAIAVYERVRPIDEAHALARAALVATLDDLLDELAEQVPDLRRAPTAEAVAALFDDLEERADLRQQFVHDGQVDVASLVEWAANHGVNDPSSAAQLAEHGPIYDRLRRALAYGDPLWWPWRRGAGEAGGPSGLGVS